MAVCDPSNAWLSRRSALGVFFAVAGCGFQPIYEQPDALIGQFDFQTDETLAGFRLRDRLEDRLGVPREPSYLLKVTQSSNASRAAVTEEGDSTRYNISGVARWRLIDPASGAVIDNGTVNAFSSYSATGSTVATQSAGTDAQARLSVALADLIVHQLMARMISDPS